ARPKGAVGSWITKKSNSAFAGSPLTCTSICSTGPSGVMVTVAVASGKHAAAPAETTMLNVTWACAPTAAQGPAERATSAITKKKSFMVLLLLCDSDRGGLNPLWLKPPIQPGIAAIVFRNADTSGAASRGDDGGDREFISRLPCTTHPDHAP